MEFVFLGGIPLKHDDVTTKTAQCTVVMGRISNSPTTKQP